MKVLFMCVANSARSQLAEGLGRALLPQVDVQSAGSNPGKLNPFAVKVMSEIGIDISNHFSKSVDDLQAEYIASLDYIITLCAEEVCPTVLSTRAKRLHWPFPDPATTENLPEAEMLVRFRGARDAIQARLNRFKKEVLT